MYTKGHNYIRRSIYKRGPGSGGVGVRGGGAGWGGGQVEGGGRGRSLLFLLSEEPVFAGDIITQHH